MSHFSQAIAELIEKISRNAESNCQITQTLDESPEFLTIDWLEAQPHFPKFYWRSRDTREEAIALGKVHTFSDPAPAYVILAENQRVWGGKAFDGGDDEMHSYFFLPQIELARFDDKWVLKANIAEDNEAIIRALQDLVLESPSLPEIYTRIQSVKHCPDMPQWSSMIDEALQSIEQDKFKKVVLARKTEVALDSPISGAQLLKASIERNHHSFHFLFALDSESAFIGSTPERLYSRIGQQLETEALAGTIGRGSNAQKDLELANWLAGDRKNLQENQYVVDDIVERLSPHAESIEVQEEANLIRLRKVQHLKREIHSLLKMGVNGVQLLSALQPTAAVAGLPREQAMAFIRDKEPMARGWYSGSVGYISHQKAEFCVAIRSAQVWRDRLALFAGAGIVPGSCAEYEWQELDKKMSTLLSLISEQFPLGVAS